MQVRRVLAVIVVVCAIAALYFATHKAKPEKAPYLIGAVFDITGPGSPLGTPERDTVMMLEDSINKDGGINGRPVKIIVYDNGSEETKCLLAVKKLIEADNVKAIIGPSATGTTLAVANTCEKANIPLISCAAGIKITQPVRPYIFKTAQADAPAVAKIIDYLKEKAIDSVAFIHDSNAFGVGGKEQFAQQSKKAGITVVAYESFGNQDTDATSQLARIKAKDPQAVICWGTNPGPAIIAKNMVQLEMKMPLINSHGVANKKFIELAGNAAEGVILPAGKIVVAEELPDSDPQKAVLVGYKNQFASVYKREADGFGGYAWDACQLVVDAIKKVGDDPTKIRTQIENTKEHVGVSGVFNFSESDHNGLSKDAFVMVQVENGQWALAK